VSSFCKCSHDMLAKEANAIATPGAASCLKLTDVAVLSVSFATR
jgi:hypothetical protein